MHQPIRHPAAGIHCHAPQAVPLNRANYLRVLLRIFAELACRLR
jgi:hypothetical protein